ncbi:sigma 54-interacting transcriptional regulator [Lysobacter sp. F60174L2]|uniref:sigma 54-interacting transcriptional regulator n=1 Tax=Lysobacter sp. F60174L2 TaxID=3459295 RepID=UPI00403E1A0D
MAAVPAEARRCVIWFGKPLRREREALAAAGWRVRVADPRNPTGIGLRGDDTVVGLVDLRDRRAASAQPLERLATECTHLALVAVVPGTRGAPAATADGAATDRLLRQCVESFDTPLDLSRLIHCLEELGHATHAPTAHGVDALVGDSPAMREVHAGIRRYAPVELPVLIIGDTGTGKEVAARALHQLSPRGDRRFAAINCGALPANLVQSELFGHERGAFTGAHARHAGLFESADGGTVFLDEIGDLPLEAQTNLLRVLQEGSLERVGSHQPIKVDVRVLAASNIDLDKAIAEGRFRSDLYYRLNVLRLRMPPLAERGDDIELLARHFLDGFRARHATRARGFDPDARRAMQAYAWPGNVRELLNRVQRAAVNTDAELIGPAALGLGDGDTAAKVDGSLTGARGAAEQQALLACLRECGFNISEAARRLKVSRVTVYRLCRKHGLVLEELR